jgi:hypothetical protein
MKTLFPRNIGTKGRIVRGLTAALLFAGAGVAFAFLPWLGWILTASGAFVLFEALRGWCALRACGIRTKL